MSASSRSADQYDVAIIGSGGGAFAAAIRAQERGARVVMIERGTIGGTCVNIGCVPSKTLLQASKTYHAAGHHPFRGLRTEATGVDMAALVAQKDALVGRLRQEKYIDLIEDYGWTLIRGEASFLDAETLAVDDRRIAAKAFIIATGARPSTPDIPGLDAVEFLTSTSALSLDRVPKSLAVIGSGYIALELGMVFQRLGSRVTLIQRSPKLLKTYEPEVSEAMTAILAGEGIELVSGARYQRVERGGSGARVRLLIGDRPRVVEAESLLVAAGRQPNTEALQLERAGVRTGERGQILVDDHARTSNPRVFAVGDVTDAPQFVYVAAYLGQVAADNALGGDRTADLRVVPGVIFTSPSVATVGLTESAARAAGRQVKTSVLPLDSVPRALVNHDTRGVFKLVADANTDELLGAHVVAENAGDVIYAAVLAIQFRLKIKDIAETLAPYLTMSEGLKLAALTFERSVSKLSCCAG